MGKNSRPIYNLTINLWLTFNSIIKICDIKKGDKYSFIFILLIAIYVIKSYKKDIENNNIDRRFITISSILYIIIIVSGLLVVYFINTGTDFSNKFNIFNVLFTFIFFFVICIAGCSLDE